MDYSLRASMGISMHPRAYTLALAALFILGSFPGTAWASAPEEVLGSETASESFIQHGRQSADREDGLVLSGDIYIDTGYEKSARALESEPDIAFWLQQGRFMLQVTPTHNAGLFFFKANAQFLAHVDEIRRNENIDTDDAWMKFGVWDVWDIQVGRFEAWEVYHKGQGLERDTLEDLGAYDGPDIYEVNYAFYRQDGFGQLAVHAYPMEVFRVEVSSVFGNELGFNSIGVRPAGILDLGMVKFKLAAEWRKLENQEEGKLQEEEKKGLGGSIQLFLDEPGVAVPVQLGVNYAYGIVDKIDPFGNVDEKGSPDTMSFGGFANLGFQQWSMGLGYNHTIEEDRQRNDQTGKTGHFEHKQGFVSLKHPLVVPEATFKVVLAYARAELTPGFDNPRTNEMYSVRARMLYRF